MSHGDAIVNGYGVKLGSVAAKLLDFSLDNLSDLMKMSVTRDELCKRVYNGNDWLAKLFSFHAVGYPKSTCSCHAAAFCADRTAEFVFHSFYFVD
jgi:hypothetical protein